MDRPGILRMLLCTAISAGCGGAQTQAPQLDAAPKPPPASSATSSSPVRHVSRVDVPPSTKAVVDAQDREDADRALDAGRHPGELLAFFGVSSGMKVADLGAGRGYTTELLARAVGPGGVVFSQNSELIAEKFAGKPWGERLAKPVNKNVVKVVRPFEDPLPPEAKDLDAVFCVLFYHDTFWLEVDRAKMNAAVFRALKVGGRYAIVDHSGRPKSGATEVKTLHRIEESVVREEIERAGFRLAGEAEFLRNAADARDWNDAPNVAAERRGTSDRFVLEFVKP